MDLPNISYQVRKKAPKPKPKPRPRSSGLSDLSTLFGADAPKSRVGEFWDIYHGIVDGSLTEEATRVKADILAVAHDKGYAIKGDLDKTVAAFTQLGLCPWGKEMCPCSRLKETGACKKGMLV